MAVVARWFPDRKGLAVGLTIEGFGLSPLITAPIANALIEDMGVRSTLRVLAVVFGVMSVAIASTLRLPPTAWIPRSAGSAKATQVPPGPRIGAIENRTALRQLLRSRSFYGLWMGYGLAACVGLSAIGISGPVGEEIIQMSPGVAARSVHHLWHRGDELAAEGQWPSVESLLGVGLNRAVGGGDGHTGQHEAGRDLVFIEKGLILLIDAAADQLAGAGRTGPSSAGHRKIDILIGRSIKDRLVVGARDGAVQALVGIDEGDLVLGHGNGVQSPARDRGAPACSVGFSLAKSPFGVIAPAGGAARLPNPPKWGFRQWMGPSECPDYFAR